MKNWFLPLLTLVLITLKLAGVGIMANASWWIVLAPMWIPFAIAMGCLIVLGIAVCLDKKTK